MQNVNEGSRSAAARSQNASASSDVAMSNSTTNHFLGTQQRSWMKLGHQARGGISSATPAKSQRPPKPQRSNTTPALAFNAAHTPVTAAAEAAASTVNSSVPAPRDAPLPSYHFASTLPPTVGPLGEAATAFRIPEDRKLRRASQITQEDQAEHDKRTDAISDIADRMETAATSAQALVIDLTERQDDHEPTQRREEQQRQQYRTAPVQLVTRYEHVPSSSLDAPEAIRRDNENSASTVNGHLNVRSVGLMQAPQQNPVCLPSPIAPPHRPTNTIPSLNPNRMRRQTLDSPITLTQLQEQPDIVSPVNTTHAKYVNSSATQTATHSHLLTPATSPLHQVDQNSSRKRPLEDLAAQHVGTRTAPRMAQGQHPIQPFTVSAGSPSFRGTQETQMRNQQVILSDPNSHQNPSHPGHPRSRQHLRRSFSLSAQSSLQSGHPFHFLTQPHVDTALQHHAQYVGQHDRRGSQSYLLNNQSSSASISAPQSSYRGYSYLATLDSTIGDIARRSRLSGAARELRIPWIRDACQQNDLFFLLLNQLFCTWSLNRNLVISLNLDSNCDSGFQVLGLLFASNTELSEELIAFLAGWPNSTYSLKASPELTHWITNTRRFLPQLGRLWENFRRDCLLRQIPPFAREIVEVFHCPISIIFPRAVFSSLDRQIHPEAPPALQSATYDLFVRNQKLYYASLYSNDNQLLPPTVPIADEFHAFAVSYRNLVAQHAHPLYLSNAAASQPSAKLQSQNIATISAVAANELQTQDRTGANPTTRAPSLQSRVVRTPTLSAVPNTTIFTCVSPGPGSVSGSARAQSQSANLNRDVFLRSSQSNDVAPVQHDPNSSRINRSESLTTMAALMSQNSATNIFLNRSLTTTSNAMDKIFGALLPELGNLPPLIVDPITEQDALHQAHLRQPLTQIKGDKMGNRTRLYQMIDHCVLKPYLWKPEDSFFSLDFDVHPDLIGKRVETMEPAPDSFHVPKRIFSPNSVLFNLRCTHTTSNSQILDESEWAALSTYWPQHMFVSLNETHLEIRRKRHHRRDLPIDVTSLVVPGKNTVKVSLHPENSDAGKKLAIAVEVIGLHDGEQARCMPTKIFSDDSLAAIKAAMQTAVDVSDNDDDMRVVNDTLILSVTDPFLSSMFTTPVRGKMCKHRECFDLDTFLQSRTSDHNDALTSVYQWQCPTCGKDARPSNLVVDGFLQEVRTKLVADGELDARAIIVQADGTWTVKRERNRGTSRDGARPQNNEGVESNKQMSNGQAIADPLSHEAPKPFQKSQLSTTTSVIEIIDLDDD